MCGRWGVCGAVASVGAALSILEQTGPLTSDDSWGSHMGYTSRALGELSRIGGPRCCKRDAYVSLLAAVDYVRDRFGVSLQKDDISLRLLSAERPMPGREVPVLPRDGLGRAIMVPYGNPGPWPQRKAVKHERLRVPIPHPLRLWPRLRG
jgi:hypothetical protein